MPPMRMPLHGKKAKNPGKTMLRLLSYMKKYVPIMILVLICIFINTYAQTAGSSALGVGGDLVNKTWIAEGAFDKIAQAAKDYAEAVK